MTEARWFLLLEIKIFRFGKPKFEKTKEQRNETTIACLVLHVYMLTYHPLNLMSSITSDYCEATYKKQQIFRLKFMLRLFPCFIGL